MYVCINIYIYIYTHIVCLRIYVYIYLYNKTKHIVDDCFNVEIKTTTELANYCGLFMSTSR